MKKTVSRLISAFLVFCTAALAYQGMPDKMFDPEAGTSPVMSPDGKTYSKAEIDGLIRDLGDSKSKVRDAAQQKLLDAGSQVEEALAAASKSDDPEVSIRAGKVLSQVRGGLPTGQFSELVEMAVSGTFPNARAAISELASKDYPMLLQDLEYIWRQRFGGKLGDQAYREMMNSIVDAQLSHGDKRAFNRGAHIYAVDVLLRHAKDKNLQVGKFTSPQVLDHCYDWSKDWRVWAWWYKRAPKYLTWDKSSRQYKLKDNVELRPITEEEEARQNVRFLFSLQVEKCEQMRPGNPWFEGDEVVYQWRRYTKDTVGLEETQVRYDIKQRKEVKKTANEKGEFYMVRHPSDDKGMLVRRYNENTVVVVNGSTRTPVANNGGNYDHMFFLPGGKEWALAGCRSLSVYSYPQAQLIWSTNYNVNLSSPPVAMSKSGRFVAIGGAHIVLVDMKERKITGTSGTHVGPGMVFSHDEQYLMAVHNDDSAGSKTYMKWYKVPSMEEVEGWSPEGPMQYLAVSGDGRFLALSSMLQGLDTLGRLTIYDLKQKKVVSEWHAMDCSIWNIEFHPTRNLLLIQSNECNVLQFWEYNVKDTDKAASQKK